MRALWFGRVFCWVFWCVGVSAFSPDSVVPVVAVVVSVKVQSYHFVTMTLMLTMYYHSSLKQPLTGVPVTDSTFGWMQFVPLPLNSARCPVLQLHDYSALQQQQLPPLQL